VNQHQDREEQNGDTADLHRIHGRKLAAEMPPDQPYADRSNRDRNDKTAPAENLLDTI
jgi:hypothetical protein